MAPPALRGDRDSGFRRNDENRGRTHSLMRQDGQHERSGRLGAPCGAAPGAGPALRIQSAQAGSFRNPRDGEHLRALAEVNVVLLGHPIHLIEAADHNAV